MLGPNSRYTVDILDASEREVFYQGGVNSETVKSQWSDQISSLDSLRTFRQSTTNKVSISLFRLSQQVLFLCERCVNFHHFEMLPSLSR